MFGSKLGERVLQKVLEGWEAIEGLLHGAEDAANERHAAVMAAIAALVPAEPMPDTIREALAQFPAPVDEVELDEVEEPAPPAIGVDVATERPMIVAAGTGPYGTFETFPPRERTTGMVVKAAGVLPLPETVDAPRTAPVGEVDEWWTIRRLAEKSGRSYQHVAGLVKRGDIEGAVHEPGRGRGTWKLPRAACEAFVAARRA